MAEQRAAPLTGSLAMLLRYPFPYIQQILLDASVIGIVFCVGSQIAWGNWRIWQQPLVWPQILLLMGALSAGKANIMRKPVLSKVEFIRRAWTWTTAVYLVLMAFIFFTRGYYSRPLLLVSFSLLMAWHVLHSFLAKKSLGRLVRLAVVPLGMGKTLSENNGRGEGAEREFEIVPMNRPTYLPQVSGLVVDFHTELSAEWTQYIAECAAAGIPVLHAAAVYEMVNTRVPLSHTSKDYVWSLFSGKSPYLPVKRVMDVVLVILSLPVTIPLGLVIALLIYLDSKGPIIFRQERVGRFGQPFCMLKFRSMYPDAEAEGCQFAAPDDKRVTRFGRILRKYRLDELPQLINVLKGEMSLIGPRPEQVAFVREFERDIPFYSWRHQVKPGITGLAQVRQGYAAGVDENTIKLEYDLYYIKHISFSLDLTIAMETIATIFNGNGAR